jgi:hypothetical protein
MQKCYPLLGKNLAGTAWFGYDQILFFQGQYTINWIREMVNPFEIFFGLFFAKLCVNKF